MKLIPFFWGIFLVIIPVQLFAQKDTLKPNWGINNLQIGIAQPADVCAYYNKHLPPPSSFKNPNYKKIKIKRTSFHFIRVDSIFVLKSISIKPSAKKFYVQKELNVSMQTKVKDLVAVLATPRISHLIEFNSIIYKSTIFKFNGLSCSAKPVKGDLTSSSSEALAEYLIEDYKNSKIKTLFIYCSTCDFPFYPNSEEFKKAPQLFYSRNRHYIYYKDKDSLTRIYADHGCVECSYLPYFSVNYYTQKKRLKTTYSSSGFLFYRNKADKLSKTLRRLKRGALRKTEYLYFGKHCYRILWRRKSIRFPYLIQGLKHKLL
jgi:hypothetical protein